MALTIGDADISHCLKNRFFTDVIDIPVHFLQRGDPTNDGNVEMLRILSEKFAAKHYPFKFTSMSLNKDIDRGLDPEKGYDQYLRDSDPEKIDRASMNIFQTYKGTDNFAFSPFAVDQPNIVSLVNASVDDKDDTAGESKADATTMALLAISWLSGYRFDDNSYLVKNSVEQGGNKIVIDPVSNDSTLTLDDTLVLDMLKGYYFRRFKNFDDPKYKDCLENHSYYKRVRVIDQEGLLASIPDLTMDIYALCTSTNEYKKEIQFMTPDAFQLHEIKLCWDESGVLQVPDKPSYQPLVDFFRLGEKQGSCTLEDVDGIIQISNCTLSIQ